MEIEINGKKYRLVEVDCKITHCSVCAFSNVDCVKNADYWDALENCDKYHIWKEVK